MKRILEIAVVIFIVGCSQHQNTTIQNPTTATDSPFALQLIKGPAYLTSLQFKNDYPTHETENKLYDAIDFQIACQAYIGMAPLLLKHERTLLPPQGFPYWQKLSDIINTNDLHENEKFFVAMLKPLGIEKGKLFQPSLHQKIILTQAAEIGFRMTQMINLGTKYDSAAVYGNTHWKNVSHDVGNKNLTQNLLVAKDKAANWLDGGKYYQLHIPGNIPAASWTLTIVDNSTGQVIQNNEPRSSFDSKAPTYMTNSDGSVDVFFGSIAPSGEGTNWLRTLPGNGWFAYLALSKPTQDFFDFKWKLNELENVDEKIWKGSSK